jgi:outer membrane lipoprotein carrier protein
MARLLLPLFLLFAVFPSGWAASLDRFQAYLKSIQSASANFDQEVYDKTGKLVQESHGSFVLQRPGKFRWSYAKPHPQVIVGDGERVWIHDQDLNQVTVRKIARAIGASPAALLAGSAEIEKSFEFSEAGTKEGLEWLEARPRDKEAGFERVRLGLSADGVEAMELLDNFGQTTRLRFMNVIRNPRIDSNTFRFTPPKGADVLGQD